MGFEAQGFKGKVTVVVPTYNEAENLPRLAEEIFSLGIPHLKLLVVDDASLDGTGEVAEGLKVEHSGVQVIHRPGKQGLGSAYQDGFQAALADGAEYVVQMDADLSHSPKYISALLEKVASFDVVVGSRYVPGGGADQRWGVGRRLLSWGGNLYARWVAGLKARDVTSGFKCFSRRGLERLNLGVIRSRGFCFQIEVAYQCQKRGLRVTEVPITFEERVWGRSKLGKDIIWEALWQPWRMRVWSKR